MANEVKDYGKKPLTMEEMEAYFKQQRDLESTNIVKLAGKVLSMRETAPRQKMKADEHGKFTIPLFDDEGEPLMWDSKYFITLAFEGGQIEINIPKNWAKEISLNNRILVEGNKLADKSGVVKDNFHRFVILA